MKRNLIKLTVLVAVVIGVLGFNTKKAEAAPNNTFKFNGYTLKVSGQNLDPYYGAAVRAQNNTIYQMRQHPHHFVVDSITNVPRYMNTLKVGNKINVKGKTYRIYKKIQHVDSAAGSTILQRDLNNGAKITIQMDEGVRAKSGCLVMTFWFAK